MAEHCCCQVDLQRAHLELHALSRAAHFLLLPIAMLVRVYQHQEFDTEQSDEIVNSVR